MNVSKKISAKELDPTLDLKSISISLTNRQKEVLKLLQKKEVLIIDSRSKVFVTCGREAKKVTPHLFYNLVNKNLVYHQTEWPYNYVLSPIGKIIKI